MHTRRCVWKILKSLNFPLIWNNIRNWKIEVNASVIFWCMVLEWNMSELGCPLKLRKSVLVSCYSAEGTFFDLKTRWRIWIKWGKVCGDLEFFSTFFERGIAEKMFALFMELTYINFNYLLVNEFWTWNDGNNRGDKIQTFKVRVMEPLSPSLKSFFMQLLDKFCKYLGNWEKCGKITSPRLDCKTRLLKFPKL